MQKNQHNFKSSVIPVKTVYSRYDFCIPSYLLGILNRKRYTTFSDFFKLFFKGLKSCQKNQHNSKSSVIPVKTVYIGFKKIVLGFPAGWGEERTPTISECWGSLSSPQPTPNNYLKHYSRYDFCIPSYLYYGFRPEKPYNFFRFF